MSDPEPSTATIHAYSPEAKAKAVLRVLRGESVSAVACDIGVSEHRLARWEHEFVKGGKAQLAQPRNSQRGLRRRLRKHGTLILQWAGILILLALIVRVLTKFFEPGGE